MFIGRTDAEAETPVLWRPAEFAVTRERIRQIEAKALSKLRKNKDTKKLHEYLKIGRAHV